MREKIYVDITYVKEFGLWIAKRNTGSWKFADIIGTGQSITEAEISLEINEGRTIQYSWGW